MGQWLDGDGFFGNSVIKFTSHNLLWVLSVIVNTYLYVSDSSSFIVNLTQSFT